MAKSKIAVKNPRANKISKRKQPKGVLDPWQAAAGNAVSLDSLLNLSMASGGAYLSGTVTDVLLDAALNAEFLTRDNRRVVTPLTYIRAVGLSSGAGSSRQSSGRRITPVSPRTR